MQGDLLGSRDIVSLLLNFVFIVDTSYSWQVSSDLLLVTDTLSERKKQDRQNERCRQVILREFLSHIF